MTQGARPDVDLEFDPERSDSRGFRLERLERLERPFKTRINAAPHGEVAAVRMLTARIRQRRLRLSARILRVPAPSSELAATRRVGQVRRLPGDVVEPPAAGACGPRRPPSPAARRRAPRCTGGGVGEQRRRRRGLDDLPGVHHRHPVAGRRSRRSRASPGSSPSGPPRRAFEQFEDLRLDGHVERRGRLVGDHQLGLEAIAIAIITRWRMPPESSCGIGARAALRA